MRTFMLALMVCAASVFAAGEAFACGACSKKNKEAVEKAEKARETTAGEDKTKAESEAKGEKCGECKGECKEGCKSECKEECAAGAVFTATFNDKATKADIEKAATAIKALAGVKAASYCEKSNKLFIVMEKDKAIDQEAVKKAAADAGATISTLAEHKADECKECDKAAEKKTDTKS